MTSRILSLLLIVFTSAMFGQSYHTISIDGSNDFNNGFERIETTSDSTLYAYITWDRNYLYVGFSGSTTNGNLTDNDRVYHIYIDTDPKEIATDGTGTTDGELWRWDPTLPFSANYHYTFMTTNNSEFKRIFTTQWDAASFGTDNWKSDGFWEVRINLNDIGSPEQLNLVAYVEEDWETGNICGGVPSNLFTNTTTQGEIVFNQHFENFFLIDSIYSNLDFNVDNYQFSVRLNASVGSLADTSTYAGMAINASNDYDQNIDLPKPPTPPSGYIQLYFNEPDWGSVLGPNYSRNFKKLISLDSTTTSWNFKVATDQTDPVTISADKFSLVPDSYEITLYNLSNQAEQDLRTGSYQFTPSGGSEFDFRLTIGITLPEPNIAASVDTLNFGEIKTNADSTISFLISNTGDSTLTITNIFTSASAFINLSNTGYTIAPNSSENISIKFDPAVAIEYSELLKIVSNDPDTDTLSIVLKGTGLALEPNISVDKISLDFGNVKVDYDSTLTFKIYNTGDTTLSISNLIFSNSAYTVSGNTTFPVFAGDSVEKSISFMPTAVEDYSSTLKIISDDPDTDTLQISILGNGINSIVEKSFAAGWHLMSSPVDPADKKASNLIGDDADQYLFYKYNSGNYFNSDSISVGSAYWLGIESAANIDIEGTPVIDTFSTSLNAGWNLVASPYIRKYSKDLIEFNSGDQWISSDSALNAGLIQNQYYSYNNVTKGYYSEDTLEQWAGYWLAALKQNIEMRFLHDKTSGDPLTEPQNIQLNDTGWKVHIIAELNDSKDDLLYLGEDYSKASNGFDPKLDYVKPPKSPSNGIYAYFKQKDYSDYFDKFSTLIHQSDFADWNLIIEANENGTVKLSWPDIENEFPGYGDDSYNLAMWGNNADVTLDHTPYLKFEAEAGNVYSFNINTIMVGIDDEQINYSFKLDQNYPNPFNPSTRISYSIPEDGNVSLKIYDILGTEITTLVNEYKNKGKYDINFDASNLASGVYFYRLNSGSYTSIKKMILLR